MNDLPGLDQPRVPANSLEAMLTKVEDGLVIIAGSVVFVLMLVVTADVLSRTFWHRPLPNSYEYMELGMVLIVYLGISKVQREKGHIAIDLITSKLPDKAGAVLQLSGFVAGLIMMGAIAWWGAVALWESYTTSEYIGSVSRIPVSPARLGLVIGALIMWIRLAVDGLRTLSQLVDHE